MKQSQQVALKNQAQLVPQLLPRKLVNGFLAGIGFAVIGMATTAKFCIETVASGIARFSGTSREKEWAPVLLSTVFFALMMYLLLVKLMRAAPAAQAQPIQNSFEDLFLKSMQPQHNTQPSRSQGPSIEPVDDEVPTLKATIGVSNLKPANKSTFDSNLQQAGCRLFQSPGSSDKPNTAPASDPAGQDNILDAAIVEFSKKAV